MSRVAILLAFHLAAGPAMAEDRPLPRPPPPAVVCGDPALAGTPLPRVDDGGGCGIADPIVLSRAAEVALDPPATVGCGAARALAAWLAAVKPAFPDGLAAVTVVDAYSCRKRNRAAEGKLSEHALGNALDLSAFRAQDGTVLTVAAGWTDSVDGPLLRRLHAAACGRFGTVLGPGANALHRDHLHLDVEARGSGPYCQ